MKQIKLLVAFCILSLQYSAFAMHAFKKVQFPKATPFSKCFSISSKKNIDLNSFASLGQSSQDDEEQKPLLPKESQPKLLSQKIKKHGLLFASLCNKYKEQHATVYKNFTKKSNDFVVDVVEDIDSIVPKQPFSTMYKEIAKKTNDFVTEVAKDGNDVIVGMVEDIDSMVPKQPFSTMYKNVAKKTNDFVVEVVEDIDSIVPKQPFSTMYKKIAKKSNDVVAEVAKDGKKRLKKLLKKINKML